MVLTLNRFSYIIFTSLSLFTERVGQSQGHKATQIVLLMLPVLFVVLGFAVYVLNSEGGGAGSEGRAAGAVTSRLAGRLGEVGGAKKV